MTTTAEEPGVATRSEKFVYLFGDGQSDGDQELRNLLGGKGAGLAEMSSLGIPVPPGFTITSEVCNSYYDLGRSYPAALEDQVRDGLAYVESLVGSRFGDPENPLLVSVRSGARVSMPGMMDTILNLGLNDATAEGLAKRSGNARFAYDSYRRFVQMYGDVVLGVGKQSDTDTDPYERLLDEKKRSRGVTSDTDLGADALRELVGEYKALIRERGEEFPDDPWDQLWGRGWRGVRELGEPAGGGLPRSVRISLELGHGGERAGDGVRQPGRRLRHGRALHAEPVHRRGTALRRVPGERTG